MQGLVTTFNSGAYTSTTTTSATTATTSTSFTSCISPRTSLLRSGSHAGAGKLLYFSWIQSKKICAFVNATVNVGSREQIEILRHHNVCLSPVVQMAYLPLKA